MKPQDHSVVLFEGFLIKSPPEEKSKDPSRWKKRYFRLFSNKTLLYYKDQKSKHHIKKGIDLSLCSSIDAKLVFKRWDHVLGINTPSRTYYLVAKDEYVMKQWLHNICDLCGFKEDPMSIPQPLISTINHSRGASFRHVQQNTATSPTPPNPYLVNIGDRDTELSSDEKPANYVLLTPSAQSSVSQQTSGVSDASVYDMIPPAKGKTESVSLSPANTFGTNEKEGQSDSNANSYDYVPPPQPAPYSIGTTTDVAKISAGQVNTQQEVPSTGGYNVVDDESGCTYDYVPPPRPTAAKPKGTSPLNSQRKSFGDRASDTCLPTDEEGGSSYDYVPPPVAVDSVNRSSRSSFSSDASPHLPSLPPQPSSSLPRGTLRHMSSSPPQQGVKSSLPYIVASQGKGTLGGGVANEEPCGCYDYVPPPQPVDYSPRNSANRLVGSTDSFALTGGSVREEDSASNYDYVPAVRVASVTSQEQTSMLRRQSPDRLGERMSEPSSIGSETSVLYGMVLPSEVTPELKHGSSLDGSLSFAGGKPQTEEQSVYDVVPPVRPVRTRKQNSLRRVLSVPISSEDAQPLAANNRKSMKGRIAPSRDDYVDMGAPSVQSDPYYNYDYVPSVQPDASTNVNSNWCYDLPPPLIPSSHDHYVLMADPLVVNHPSVPQPTYHQMESIPQVNNPSPSYRTEGEIYDRVPPRHKEASPRASNTENAADGTLQQPGVCKQEMSLTPPVDRSLKPTLRGQSLQDPRSVAPQQEVEPPAIDRKTKPSVKCKISNGHAAVIASGDKNIHSTPQVNVHPNLASLYSTVVGTATVQKPTMECVSEPPYVNTAEKPRDNTLTSVKDRKISSDISSGVITYTDVYCDAPPVHKKISFSSTPGDTPYTVIDTTMAQAVKDARICTGGFDGESSM